MTRTVMNAAIIKHRMSTGRERSVMNYIISEMAKDVELFGGSVDRSDADPFNWTCETTPEWERTLDDQ